MGRETFSFELNKNEKKTVEKKHKKYLTTQIDVPQIIHIQGFELINNFKILRFTIQTSFRTQTKTNHMNLQQKLSIFPSNSSSKTQTTKLPKSTFYSVTQKGNL